MEHLLSGENASNEELSLLMMIGNLFFSGLFLLLLVTAYLYLGD